MSVQLPSNGGIFCCPKCELPFYQERRFFKLGPRVQPSLCLLLSALSSSNSFQLFGCPKTIPFATFLARPWPKKFLIIAREKSTTVASSFPVIKFPSITTFDQSIIWQACPMTIAGSAVTALSSSKPCCCKIFREEQIPPNILPACFCSLSNFFRILDLCSLSAPAGPPF
uniref:Uncharacterized protein n=1 Tax=Arundo donax TaxID=35708 RepID=A0A0A9GYH8_ARUDO